MCFDMFNDNDYLGENRLIEFVFVRLRTNRAPTEKNKIANKKVFGKI